MTHQLTRLQDVKVQLNILHDDDDDKLKLLIDAAEESVLSYLGDNGQSPWWNGDLVSGYEVPDRVRIAVAKLVGIMHWEKDEYFEFGKLPFPVTSLLYQMRDPALG